MANSVRKCDLFAVLSAFSYVLYFSFQTSKEYRLAWNERPAQLASALSAHRSSLNHGLVTCPWLQGLAIFSKLVELSLSVIV